MTRTAHTASKRRLCIATTGAAALLFALLVGAPVQANDEDAVLYLEHARLAAHEDAHVRSIDLYKRAIATDSTLYDKVASELAYQYLWADMPDSAIAWFEVAVYAVPYDIHAHLGLARALSWSDRHGIAEHHYRKVLPYSGPRRHEALNGLGTVQAWRGDLEYADATFRTVLDEDPDNIEARNGLAMVTNWSGRHRTAARMYEGVLDTAPLNSDAIKGLAYAQYWSGRRGAAYSTLQSGLSWRDYEKTVEAMEPGRFNTKNTLAYRDNSNDGSYRSLTMEIRAALNWLNELTVRYDKGVLEQSGVPDTDRDELTLVLRQPVTPWASLTAAPGYQWNEFRDGAGDFDLFVWDVYGTVNPIDWVRIDVGNARESLDIPEPLFRDLHVTTTNVGVDWRLGYRLLTVWEVGHAAYSDDNSRRSASHRTEWMPFMNVPRPWRNAFTVVGGVEYLDHDRQASNGYFSPLTYVNLFHGVRYANDVTPRVRVEAEALYGAEHENGEDWTSKASFDGALRYRFQPTLDVTIGYNASGSRLDSPDGYRANRVYLTVDYLIGR